MPSDIPAADTISNPANATVSSPPDITLNNTVLENPALLDDVAGSALLEEGNAVLANNTADPPSYETRCWSSEQIYPIQHPIDCYEASRLIYQEGPAFTPVVWSGSRDWVFGSCALILIPDKVETVDVFFRYDIVAAVSQIQNECVNLEHEFKGGFRGIGPRFEFHVSVESRQLPRGRGISFYLS